MGSIITVLFAGISAMLIAPSALSFGGAVAQRKAAEQHAKYEAFLKRNPAYVPYGREK